MFGLGLLLIAVAGASVVLLYRHAKPARAIWRGDASRVPRMYFHALSAQARTYLTYLLCLGTLTIGMTLVGLVVALAVMTRPPVMDGWLAYPLVTGMLLLLSGVVLLPLHWFVEAAGRPKFLVPPPYRDQSGYLAAGMARRRRKRAGLPETDHPVGIFDVRPGPDDDYEPYCIAICDHAECFWTGFADGDVLGPSEEDQVRAKAAKHSTNVAAETLRR